MKHLQTFESHTTKPDTKYKKGDAVKYIPKLSGHPSNKKLIVKSSNWKDKDELNKKFKPIWLYSFENSNLSAIETDIKPFK